MIGPEGCQPAEIFDSKLVTHDTIIDGNAEKRQERGPRCDVAAAETRVVEAGRRKPFREVGREGRGVEIAGYYDGAGPLGDAGR